MKNIFDKKETEEVIARLHKLQADSKPLWGTMDVARMLAHCNVTYEMIYEDKHPKPGWLMRSFLKLLVKGKVVNELPYAKNSPTAPQFVIKSDKDFATEKQRLLDYIDKTLSLGASHFEGKESHSFGPLTATEWNNMLYKHLDHHLQQFGV